MVLIALAGCTSLRGKADAAYAHGDYAKAADLYDQLVRGGDTGAIPRRTQAREEELRVELYNVQAARAAGYEYIGKLALLLDQRDAWQGDGAAPLAGGIAFEVAAASAKIGAEIATRTDKDGPLAGEDVASHYEKLLGHTDFASARTAIHVQLSEAGRAHCTRYEAVAPTPYWRWLTARYCGHWSANRPVPTLPDQYRALVVDGTIAGETDEEASALRSALQDAFVKSALYAPSAAGEVHATIDGQLRVHYASRQVSLTASWTEQVPYTDYETQQESYQEPYDDTETYDEQVPTTEYVPCGDTTCPQTVYHTETKTRTVTKYRTAYRDVTVPVTRYRDEPRTEDYNAIERTGSYASALSVQIGAVTASVETATSESGYDHDVTIEPAGVSPSRANLTSHDQFAAHEAATLADRFVLQLDAAYARQFCGLPAFTLEQAAECAYAGAEHLPPAAQSALEHVFGGEVTYLARITSGSDDHAVAANR
jgi:hypothetical protein